MNPLTLPQQWAVVALCAAATLLTRFAPFWLFDRPGGAPGWVRYLGRVLPGAVFGMLVIYCLKDVAWLAGAHGAPELIALAVVVAVHLWRRQTLLSIAAGTACYMALVQWVFVS